VEELDEAVQIIKTLWSDGQATFVGRHNAIADAWCEPIPHPRPPIMIGGKKPRMLRLIARYADWWNVDWVGIDEYRALTKEMEVACAEVGRDPATLRRTHLGLFACAPTEETARALAGNHAGFIGTPAQIVEQMRPFVELGVDYFMATCLGFPDLTPVELLANEVLPALRI
jgi:alkanesulfonate monooxygenase SsuD/methylene tetrahydromethanopterin reductase-like flavin-dependent oxidoreductase (luciferase family)